jgi:alkylhydroperoxidase family enzyme
MSERLIPYQPADLREPAEIVAAVRQRRGGVLLNLDRMLLHSPPYASGWNGFLKEVRENLELDYRLRELAMCGVAVLNGAEYEFIHHAPEYLKAGGSAEQVEGIRRLGEPDYRKELFSPIEQDALELTLAMTREIKVPQSLMRRLQASLGNRQLVELVGVIATYNMVSRFLIALDVTPE